MIKNSSKKGYIKIATYRIKIATLPIDQNSDISKLINWNVYIKIATYRIKIATLPIDQNSDISKLINWNVYIKIATVAITGKLGKKYGQVLK